MFRQRLLNYVTIHASKAIFAFHTYGNSLLRHFPRKLMPAFSEELKEALDSAKALHDELIRHICSTVPYNGRFI